MSDVKTVDQVLDEVKGKLDSCLIVGFDKKGNTVIKSSVANVPYMHWMLNRSIFELALFEKQNSEEEDTEAENKEAPES